MLAVGTFKLAGGEAGEKVKGVIGGMEGGGKVNEEVKEVLGM